MRIFVLAATLMALPAIALAQAPPPYAGLQTRDIKALSEQQIADLKAGRGMGFALPAELNGYPGPAHVLELAQALNLTDGQKDKVSGLYEKMRGEAIPLGEKLIAAESDLDRLFASRTVTEASLSAAARDVAVIQGELRATHLKYHLSTLALLTPEQVARYGELRGYAASAPGAHGSHRH